MLPARRTRRHRVPRAPRVAQSSPRMPLRPPPRKSSKPPPTPRLRLIGPRQSQQRPRPAITGIAVIVVIMLPPLQNLRRQPAEPPQPVVLPKVPQQGVALPQPLPRRVANPRPHRHPHHDDLIQQPNFETKGARDADALFVLCGAYGSSGCGRSRTASTMQKNPKGALPVVRNW
jgi:hypothetical protein